MSESNGLENELRQLIKQELDSLYVPLREQNQALMDEVKALRRELSLALKQVGQ